MDNSQQTVETGPPTPPPAAHAPEARTKNGLATASLIIGILALLGAFIPFVNYGSGLLATVGAVLGLVAVIQRAKRNKTAFAGLIISGIAIILSVTLAVAYTAGFAASVADSVGSDSVAVDEPGADEPAAAEPEAAAVGTRENPAPLGTLINVEESGQPVWEITPGKAVLDANAAIAAANMFNDVPDAGMVWAMLPLTIKYVGTETGNPLIDISVKFVSAAGTTHEQYDKSAVTPNDLSDVNEMYPGATATGNIAIMIPIADAAAGTWAVAGSMFGEDFFFAAQ